MCIGESAWRPLLDRTRFVVLLCFGLFLTLKSRAGVGRERDEERERDRERNRIDSGIQ